MNKIGIIGAGFSGMMTAVQVIHKAQNSCEITLIEKGQNFGKGVAYNPYSKEHLLNVSAKKMSAFPDKPSHFLDWVMQQVEFVKIDKELIGNAYLPRKFYGVYLNDIWQNAKCIAAQKRIKIKVIHERVYDLQLESNKVILKLSNDTNLMVDQCVIATGNQVPASPKIENENFYNSPNYFQNPWEIASVKNIKDNLPILIIGNGLTMVDTVFGLLERGFKGKIYSISPNGFNILPHRHGVIHYSKLIEELEDDMSLYELVKLIKKHVRIVRRFGVSAEPVINSLRPYSQKIWRSLSNYEKELFLRRFRYLWGVARHRIPWHSYDKIQRLRIDGKLCVKTGKIINFNETEHGIVLHYFDKKEKQEKVLQVSRVINCTGPSTNLKKQNDNFLKGCLDKGLLKQDDLKLGISANTETFQIISSKGKIHTNLFTLGSNLRGELWESTAVNELRNQAQELAGQLISISKKHYISDKNEVNFCNSRLI